MLLIGVWNGNLSDRAVEEMVNDNLSAMHFCGLRLEDTVPDHTRLSKFRSELVKKNGFDAVMDLINKQLEQRSIILKTGIKVDATLTDSPRKPKGKAHYLIAEDRKEDEVPQEEVDKQTSDIKLIKRIQKGVDTEARWVKKAGKLHYGYKKHVATDETGLVVGVHTTSANEHDSLSLGTLLEKSHIPERSSLFADKAYKSGKHDKLLKDNKIKNRIQYKKAKNKELTHWQRVFNSLVSQHRYTVERTFGSCVRWFKTGVAKYVGLAKTHAQHVLESIAYNLKRSPMNYMKSQVVQYQVITK